MRSNKPWRITIDTNPDECNKKCIMCDTHSIYNKNFKRVRKSMSRELLQKTLDEAVSLGVKEIIPTTMGEPLLYKHFDLFIKELKSSNIKLNLTTNGSFPLKPIVEWADILLPISSDIKISINGINKLINESVMVGANTRKTIQSIKVLVKKRDLFRSQGLHSSTLTLQVTFLENNLDELENIILFAIENNIDRVKGHHLWVTWNELENQNLKRNNESISKWNNFIKKIDKYRNKVKLENFELILDKSQKNNTICPFLGQELWLDYDGSFNICCAPSKLRVSLGNFGNIQNRKISDVFNSEEYISLLNNYKIKDICKNCSLRKIV